MRKIKKHIGLIIVLIIVIAFPTSLSNQTKINMRVIVTGIAVDKSGEEFEVTGSDLLARALCHEIDHLDGKLFIDHVIEEIE